DMQFEGQTHLLTVPVAGPGVTREELQNAFEAAYWERFAVALDTIPAVLVNLHTAVIGARPAVPLAALGGQARAASLDGALIGTRRVWFPDGWAETPVYDRDRLPAEARFEGPAIVQQTDCTSVVEPGNRASLDSIGNLILDVGE
ncbi:MAG: hydantoinase/oxoprolinase family protein, partial [Rhodospirillales bacterium]|nr:hydantoinase/oxoprolinase family protein [Rhodospirillales bacterium]